MMALLAIFGGSFLIALSGALMPGPLFTLSVRETLRRGFWVGPLVATGHALIELVLVIALALGLSQFLAEGRARPSSPSPAGCSSSGWATTCCARPRDRS